MHKLMSGEYLEIVYYYQVKHSIEKYKILGKVDAKKKGLPTSLKTSTD